MGYTIVANSSLLHHLQEIKALGQQNHDFAARLAERGIQLTELQLEKDELLNENERLRKELEVTDEARKRVGVHLKYKDMALDEKKIECQCLDEIQKKQNLEITDLKFANQRLEKQLADASKEAEDNHDLWLESETELNRLKKEQPSTTVQKETEKLTNELEKARKEALHFQTLADQRSKKLFALTTSKESWQKFPVHTALCRCSWCNVSGCEAPGEWSRYETVLLCQSCSQRLIDKDFGSEQWNILQRIREERVAQDKKFGPKLRFPLRSFQSVVLNIRQLRIPSAHFARKLCDSEHLEHHRESWATILVEELTEALEAGTKEEAIKELIQLAAVVVASIESLLDGGELIGGYDFPRELLEPDEVVEAQTWGKRQGEHDALEKACEALEGAARDCETKQHRRAKGLREAVLIIRQAFGDDDIPF